MAFDPSKFVNPRANKQQAPEYKFDPSKFVNPRDRQEVDQGAAALARLNQMQAESTTPSSTQSLVNAAEDFSTGVLETAGSFARGTAQVGASIPETVYGLVGAENLQKTVQQHKRSLAASEIESRKRLTQASKRSPIATFLGETGPLLASGGAGLARSVLTGAAIGGLSGKVEGENRLLDTVIGGAMGKIAHGVSKLLTGRTERGFEQLAGGKERLNKTFDALKGTKGNLSPQEALGQQFRRSKYVQSTTQLSSKQADAVEKALINRNTENLKSFNKVLSDITPEGLDKAKEKSTALFKRSSQVDVPKEVAKKLSKNGTLAKRLATVSKDPDAGAQETALNKLNRWQALRGELQRDIDKELAPQADGAIKSTDRARRLIQSRNLLDKNLDRLSPEYKLARSIEQRVKIRDNFQKAFDKIKAVEGEITPAQIHQKMFSSEQYRKHFIKELEYAGVDTDSVKPLIKTLGKLSKSTVDKLLDQPAGLIEKLTNKESVNVKSGIGEAAKYVLSKAYANQGKALIETLTNPKWSDELQKLMKRELVIDKMSDVIKRKNNRIILYRELGDFLGRVGARESTKGDSK